MFIQSANFGNELILRCGHHDGIYTSGDHLHQFFEIILISGGEIEITVDGEVHIAHEGDIAIIPPYRVHSFYTAKHVKLLVCVISNRFLTDLIPLKELCIKRESSVFHASRHLWTYLNDGGFYGNTHTRMDLDAQEDYNYIHSLKATLYMILSEYFSTVPVTGSSTINNTLSKILIYISENYDKDISLESVGAALGYNPKYVSDCLKTLPGMGFRWFVNSLRVERAKNLLFTTNKSNPEITFECGFVSQASFQRVFREIAGMSPRKYRQWLLSGDNSRE